MRYDYPLAPLIRGAQRETLTVRSAAAGVEMSNWVSHSIESHYRLVTALNKIFILYVF
jgi:hypothetical protein